MTPAPQLHITGQQEPTGDVLSERIRGQGLIPFFSQSMYNLNYELHTVLFTRKMSFWCMLHMIESQIAVASRFKNTLSIFDSLLLTEGHSLQVKQVFFSTAEKFIKVDSPRILRSDMIIVHPLLLWPPALLRTTGQVFILFLDTAS